jgi:cell division protein FtsL
MAAVASGSARSARNARAIERARTAPVAPRRRSGPVAKPRPVAAPAPKVARVAERSASVLIDQLLRGRTWVVVIGALLAGIVFLNVSVLQLNRGIATTDAKSQVLERTNSTLRERVATLNSAERIQRLAEQRGYVLPQPGDVTYLRPSSANGRLAAQRITAPTATTPVTPVAPTAATTPATPVTPAAAVTPTTTAPTP